MFSAFNLIVQKFNEATQNKTKIWVLYGSETGNAEGVADALVTVGKEQGFDMGKMKLDDYFKPLINEYKKNKSYKSDGSNIENIIIVCSTTGKGEAPKGAEEFYRFIERIYTTMQKDKNKTSTIDLQHLNYAVLALGDTNYDHFCYVGKRIHLILEKFGASWVQPLTLADAAKNEKEVEDNFVNKVWHSFKFEGHHDEIEHASDVKSGVDSNENYKSMLRSFFAGDHSGGFFASTEKDDIKTESVKKDEEAAIDESNDVVGGSTRYEL